MQNLMIIYICSCKFSVNLVTIEILNFLAFYSICSPNQGEILRAQKLSFAECQSKNNQTIFRLPLIISFLNPLLTGVIQDLPIISIGLIQLKNIYNTYIWCKFLSLLLKKALYSESVLKLI